jgi:hypothetical protein
MGLTIPPHQNMFRSAACKKQKRQRSTTNFNARRIRKRRRIVTISVSITETQENHRNLSQNTFNSTPSFES